VFKDTLTTMSAAKPAYKKRRITPKPGYGTISAGAMASPFNKKLVALERKVARIERNTELKNLLTALSFNVDATGEIPATGQVCLVPQGAGDGQRIGRKCTIKSCQMRCSVGMVPAAAATASSTAHIYVIWDKQCNGAAAAVLDCWTSTNLATCMRDLANSSRFVVLYHWSHTFSPAAGVTTAYNNEQCALSWYKKVNIPLEFDSTAGAITEIQKNNICIMAGTDGASDDTIQVSGNFRICFTDD